MITALLLLPVVAVLVWLYWYLLPEPINRTGVRESRWRWMDTALFLVLLLLAAAFHHMALNADYHDAGPMFPELISAAGSYSIMAAGLAMGLWLRRRGSKSGEMGSQNG